MKVSKVYIIAFILLLLNLTQCYRNNAVRTELQAQTELVTALHDSVTYTKNRLGQEIAEKAVLRASVKDLKQQTDILSSNQKKLLNELKIADKKGTPQAGIQIKERVVFRDVQVIRNDTLIVVDSLDLENEKTIILSDTKKGTVVTIKNSNPQFRTVDVDALLIPDRKRWYNSKAFKTGLFLLGFGAGIYIAK